MMRVNIALGVALLAPTALTADEALLRRDTCSDLTNNCPIAQDFCYDYLNIGPARTTERTTLTAITKHARLTTYISTSACAVPGPMKKRGEPEIAAAATPVAHLEERATKTPACLRPYTSDPASLSSACSCYNYPITSSTRTISITKTAPDAPTTTTYAKATVTSTTLTATPTCTITGTDPNTGADVQWEIYYEICNAFRTGGYPGYYQETFPKGTLLCDALQQCANGTTLGGGKTFEVSWNEFGNRPGGPRWDCNGYGAGPDKNTFYAADNWHESYGVRRVDYTGCGKIGC